MKEYFHQVVCFSSKLNAVWVSSPVPRKEKIQQLLFPEGICYHHEKGEFLTGKVNAVFAAIPRLNSIPEDDKNKQGSIAAALSSLVVLSGQFSNHFLEDLRNLVSSNVDL